MDILDALGVIQGAIITKQRELDALSLAQQVLQDKFQPEFSARDQALAQLAAKQAEVDSARAELADAQAQISAAEAAAPAAEVTVSP